MQLKIPKREFTAEFRELAVKRVKGGQGIGAVARELGISDQTLRNWAKAFDAGKLNGPEAKAVTPEQMELSRVAPATARGPRRRPTCSTTSNRSTTGGATIPRSATPLQ